MRVEERFEILEKILKLEQRLKNFDWYYGYSDDPYVYRMGSEEQANMRLESTQLEQLGYKEEIAALWKKYQP